MRRALVFTGVAMVDVMAVTFGVVYLLSVACPVEHGAAWLIGL